MRTENIYKNIVILTCLVYAVELGIHRVYVTFLACSRIVVYVPDFLQRMLFEKILMLC